MTRSWMELVASCLSPDRRSIPNGRPDSDTGNRGVEAEARDSHGLRGDHISDRSKASSPLKEVPRLEHGGRELVNDQGNGIATDRRHWRAIASAARCELRGATPDAD